MRSPTDAERLTVQRELALVEVAAFGTGAGQLACGHRESLAPGKTAPRLPGKIAGVAELIAGCIAADAISTVARAALSALRAARAKFAGKSGNADERDIDGRPLWTAATSALR
jgi:hypothetical protein